MMNKNDNETGMRPQPMPSNDNTSTIIAPTAAGDVDNEGIDGILVGGMRDDGRSGLFRQARAVVFELGGGIIGSPGMQTEKRFVQHGITTTYEHSVDVATVAVMLALYAGFDGDRDLGNLVKSGLLHDYFLYDWHDNAPWHRLHGFTHGRTASLNALRDFGEKAINPVVVDSLCRHMFPLTASRPSYAEGWLYASRTRYARAVRRSRADGSGRTNGLQGMRGSCQHCLASRHARNRRCRRSRMASPVNVRWTRMLSG